MPISDSSSGKLHGVLRELCKHDTFCCGNEPGHSNLKLVPAISIFLHHCEAMWMKELLPLECDSCTLSDNSHFNLLSCKGRHDGRRLRKIFLSEDIGVSLLGSLKISPTSGRLQLADATGSIDVIIPDLPSNWKPSGIYEVADYYLIMEGESGLADHSGLLGSESFSCRNFFHCGPWTRKMNLTFYAYFNMCTKISKNIPVHPSMGWNYESKEPQAGRFHLIYIIHKYPVVQKFQKPLISDRSTMFVEAVILPWDLFLAGKDGNPSSVGVSRVLPLENSINCCAETSQDHPPKKKHKIDLASSLTRCSALMNDCCELSTCSNSFQRSPDGHLYPLEISCTVSVRIGNSHNSIGSGKLCCLKCKTATAAYNKLRTEKVLLEFNSENFFKYQLLQIGSYYILKHHDDEPFCSIKDGDYFSGIKVSVSSRIHFWSLSFLSDEVAENNGSVDPLQNDSSFSNRGCARQVQDVSLLRVTDKSSESCSDIYLHLDSNSACFLDFKCVEEILSGCSDEASTSFPSGAPDHTSFLPEGHLTSVRGDVIAIHGFDNSTIDTSLSCERLGDDVNLRFFQGNPSCYCIHIIVDNQMVSIWGSFSNHAHPVGFGPHVNATFHRILKVRGENKLRLTPVSFIVLNSIRIVNEQFSNKSDIQSKFVQSCASSLDNVSSGTISELIQSTDGKPMQLNCRVVAIHVLVFESNGKNYDLPSQVKSKPHLVDIPIVGFVLDDGSSTCCCWANAERAATLLRLHEELPSAALDISGSTFKWVGMDKSCWKSPKFHLERIIKKHGRITVKNYGSKIESSSQDFTVSVSSDGALSSSDENLLKFILFNACFQTLWTVVASAMDSNIVKQLEQEHLLQMEMAVLPMHNVWAMEVQCTDTLTEAKTLFQQLLDR